MSAEQIRALSDQLAAEPSSLVFLPLGEALLARGELAHALRVVRRGAERNPERSDALELLARIYLAQGDAAMAEAAWAAVLERDPEDPAARRGLATLRHRQGRQSAPVEAVSDAPASASADAVRVPVRGVGEVVHEGPSAEAPSAPRVTDAGRLFAMALEDSAQAALLLDAEGLVVAGTYETEDGDDVGAMIGAQLSGVSEEAARAMRHFGLGQWTRLLIESEAATVMMAPSGDGVTLVAAAREVPLGFVRRTLDRCAVAARAWLRVAR